MAWLRKPVSFRYGLTRCDVLLVAGAVVAGTLALLAVAAAVLGR